MCAKQCSSQLHCLQEEARKQAVYQQATLLQNRALHRRLLAERAHLRWQQNANSCQEVLLQIVELSTKMAEYRELTERLVESHAGNGIADLMYLYSCLTDRFIPAKLVRDWKTLFLAGQPLEKKEGKGSADSLTSSASYEQKSSSQLLDETDLQEYLVMHFSTLCQVTL